MLPWYARLGGDIVIGAAIFGILLAGGITLAIAPRVHPLLAYSVTLLLTWLMLFALLDTYVMLYGPR